MADDFPDRRDVLFGREPDIHKLMDRARRPGLTAVIARPMMGKTWTLHEVARRLLEEGHFLVGYHESKGSETSHLLYAVLNLYSRWLTNSTMRDQALSLWQRHKETLVPRVGQMVGLLFEKISSKELGEGVGATVRSAFDGLAEAQRDLLGGGLQLAPLSYDQAQSLVNLVARISGRRIVLILDAWEKSPSLRSEHATLEGVLKHGEEWASAHVLVAIRDPQQVAGGKVADEALQHAQNLEQLTHQAVIQRLNASIGDDARERHRMLDHIRDQVAVARGESDEVLLDLVNGYPGVLDRWKSAATANTPLVKAELWSLAAEAHALRYTDLQHLLGGLDDERLAMAAGLACFPRLDAESWEAHRSILLAHGDESSVNALIDASVLDQHECFPTYGHDTRHAAARRWFLMHKLPLLRRTADDLIRSLAAMITGTDAANLPRFEALAAFADVAVEVGVDSTVTCFVDAARAAFGDYDQVLGETFGRSYLQAVHRTPMAGILIAWTLINQGNANARHGDSIAAIADYTAAIDLPGASVEQVAMALVNRGTMNGRCKNNDAAIADYTSAIELPNGPADQAAMALVNRGVTKGQCGDSDAAMADFTAAIELPCAPAEEVARALVNRGVTNGHRSSSEAEMADYTAAIELRNAPADQVARALANRGVLHTQRGDSDAAFVDFTAAIELPGAPADQVGSALVNRGITNSHRGNGDAAIADFTSAIELPGASTDQAAMALVNRGMMNGQRGNSDAAIADFTLAIELPSVPPDQVARALVNRGLTNGECGNRTAAIVDLTAAIELPGSPAEHVAKALVTRGIMNGEGSGGCAAEIADYTAAIELPGAPADQVSKALVNRGVINSQRGDSDAAYADYTAAIELRGASAHRVAKAFLNRGILVGQRGDSHASIADYTAVIELPGAADDQVAAALVNRGVTNGQLGNSDAAISDFRAAMALPGAEMDVIQAILLIATRWSVAPTVQASVLP